MAVLIVGADRLGKMPTKLHEEGFEEVIHWNGRNKSFQTKAIPKNVDMVIFLWEFLNHNLMNNVKRQAKANGIPITFRKGRHWCREVVHIYR